MPVLRLVPSWACTTERFIPYFTQCADSKYVPAVMTVQRLNTLILHFEYSERFISELVNLCIDLLAALGESVMGNDFRKSLLAAICNFIYVR